jgi:hypothetical protein
MAITTEERDVFCVGWVGQVSPYCEALWQPQAPKSYTKSETIAAWIADTKSDAPILPYVGEVHEIVVLNSQGAPVFAGPNLELFLAWVDSCAGFSAMPAFAADIPVKAAFVGFNVKLLFLSIAATLWRRGDKLVPFRFWHSTPGIFDINDMLIPGALRNGFDVGSLLDFGAERQLPPDCECLSGAGAAVMPTALMRAQVTLALARFSQLV